MRAGGWIAFHYVMLGLGVAGLALLAGRRRWEVIPIGALIGGITVLGGLLLAVPRRNVPLMPLVLTLAAAGAAWLGIVVGGWIAERRHKRGDAVRASAH
jgi:zinc transporter ZupT